MDDRDDRPASNDPFEPYNPVTYQLAAIQTRLDGIEAAISLRNARHRQRGSRVALRTMILCFGLGLVVGVTIVVLLKLPLN